MAELFEIRSDEDLFRAIRMIEEDEWPTDQQPHFIGWPRYEITIRGEDFDGGVPTRVMPALLDLQRTVRHAYARALQKSVRSLSERERKQTELIVRLDPGSTTFWSDLEKALNAIFRDMTGRQKVLSVLGVAAMVTGAYVWEARIKAETERREIEYRKELSRQDSARWEKVLDIAQRIPDVEAALRDVQKNQTEWLRRLEDGDRLSVAGEEIVDGSLAREIVRPERKERIADRIDSVFVILSVESGSVKDGFRVRVQDTKTGEELHVSIPAGTLSEEQLEALQSGEWQKRPLRLEINTERVGNQVRKATLISAGLARAGDEEQG